MDKRIKEVVDITQAKFGLSNYYLHHHHLNRNVNLFNETEYTLSMEWFPSDATQEEDGSNPDGTASIEFNLNTGKFQCAIFVMGKSYAENGVTFTDLEGVVKWIEAETGLSSREQFTLQKVEDGEILFRGCIDDVPVSPPAHIEVKYDDTGKLTFFTIYGHFPSKDELKEETYSLSFKKIDSIAKEQLKFLEFPSFDTEKLVPVFAVEEVYVRNDTVTTIPFEPVIGTSILPIEKTLYWDEPIHSTFNPKEVQWVEDITVEQAFNFVPAHESFPIEEDEREKCIIAVIDFLRQEYPEDSGKWVVKSLHREKGYIHAITVANQPQSLVFKRKLLIMIDSQNLQVTNAIDNQMMLDMFNEFQHGGEVNISKDEAFEKLKNYYELKPYYVYDWKQKQYVLCGKIDCNQGVNASNAEIVSLHDL